MSEPPQAAAEAERLRDALKFYADWRNYDEFLSVGDIDEAMISHEICKVAEDALATTAAPPPAPAGQVQEWAVKAAQAIYLQLCDADIEVPQWIVDGWCHEIADHAPPTIPTAPATEREANPPLTLKELWRNYRHKLAEALTTRGGHTPEHVVMNTEPDWAEWVGVAAAGRLVELMKAGLLDGTGDGRTLSFDTESGKWFVGGRQVAEAGKGWHDSFPLALAALTGDGEGSEG